jgi:hypothetical protein
MYLDWDGKEKTWLLTAFDKNARGSTDVSGTVEDKTAPLSNKTGGTTNVSGTTVDRTTPLPDVNIKNKK